MNSRTINLGIPVLVLLLIKITGCASGNTLTEPATTKASPVLPTQQPTGEVQVQSGWGDLEDLSDDQVATLSSLEQVDDFPLYSMEYKAEYRTAGVEVRVPVAFNKEVPDYKSTVVLQPWGCSLFFAFGGGGNPVFGRNFDWEFSPALLLYTKPADGYASVSMVDIAYLGFSGSHSEGLTELTLKERLPLMDTPYLPFDGMNEHGLAVGMAAVPSGSTSLDPEKETIGSLGVIREILDYARTTSEAVAIFERYNIDFRGGPPIHYLIGDRSGDAVLVEFHRGEMKVIPNNNPWHQATNFLVSAANGSPEGACARYDHIHSSLSETNGNTSADEALVLLSEVSQPNTQWSIVYETNPGGSLWVVMDQKFEVQHLLPGPIR